MKIAVLGWGSLIWDQRELKISNNSWYEDGPVLPIEFARISKGGRLTLVIKPNWQEVTTRYAISAFQHLNEAIENLMRREETGISRIGYYNFLTDEKHIRAANEVIIPNLISWQEQASVDAVIWTDLPPNFSDSRQLTFDLKSINTVLEGLSNDEFASAKEYITNAPKQISTRFRSEIEQIINHIGKLK